MRTNTLIALTLILFGAVLRLVPHPWNFAPLGAIALYGGAMFGRRLRFVVPFGALLASDLIIGFYSPGVMLSVYGSFAVMVAIGSWVGRRMSAAKILAASLTSSILFFLVTNGAVWAFGHGYSRTVGGLIETYIAGLPFFRNTLASDLVYSGLFFGATAAVTAFVRRSKEGPQPTV